MTQIEPYNRAFFEACKRNDKEVIVPLLRHRRVNIDVQDPDGRTGLSYACEAGKIDVVTFLLTNSANPNIAMNNRTTPLMFAAESGSERCFTLLLDYHADPKAKDSLGNTVPIYISRQGNSKNLESLWILSHKGVDLNAQNYYEGETALTIACANGHTEVAQKLLQLGAEINHQNKNKKTPLMLAAEHNDEKTVQMLFGHPSLNLTLKDGFERTASMLVPPTNRGPKELLEKYEKVRPQLLYALMRSAHEREKKEKQKGTS